MPAQIALRSRRIALGISQAQAARRAGFKQQHYSRIERGERPLTTAMIEKIAPAFECHPADLLTMPDDVQALSRDTREAELLDLFHQLHSPKRDALLAVARSLAESEPWGQRHQGSAPCRQQLSA